MLLHTQHDSGVTMEGEEDKFYSGGHCMSKKVYWSLRAQFLPDFHRPRWLERKSFLAAFLKRSIRTSADTQNIISEVSFGDLNVDSKVSRRIRTRYLSSALSMIIQLFDYRRII
jgi:hypothetical protein